MIDVTRDFNLNVSFKKGTFSSNEKIILVEKDNKSTKFIFTFEEDINNRYVRLKFKHYLGTVKEKVLNVQENKVEFLLTKDVLIAGKIKMSISLIGNNNETLTVAEYLDNIEVKESLGIGENLGEDILEQVIPDLTEMKQEMADLHEQISQIEAISSYDGLSDKPQINGVELSENKTLDDLGIQAKGDFVEKVNGKNLSTNDFTNEDKEKLESLKNYDDTDINEQISNLEKGKADKIEIPSKLSNLTNDSGFITNTVDDLVNYYSKTESYSKEEINNIVNNISTLNIAIVESLPTEDISRTTIYLVEKENSEDNNVYDEYIYVSESWEKIGDTKISLAGLATEEYVDNKIGEIENLLAEV